MNTKDGGPAFPSEQQIVGVDIVYAKTFPGMTLRDYFAAAALTGMSYAHDYSKGPCNAAIAERAYYIADAMLAAREGEAMIHGASTTERATQENSRLLPVPGQAPGRAAS
jgi:hypothetical protein